MTELTSGPQQQSLNDLSTAPIRKQLLWAALFPLMLFGLLFTLVITSAFHQLAFDTVMQRNTAQTQALATNLSKKTIGGMLPDSQELRSVAQSIGINHNAAVYLVNPQGQLVFSSEPEPNQKILVAEEIKLLSQNPESFGQLIQTSNTNDQVMVSISTIPGINYRVILVEPWTTIIKPAAQFQLLLGGLTLLGISLTLITLSLAISRITHPIHILAENAAGAVPGSTFYPIKAKGPINASTFGFVTSIFFSKTR